MTPSTSIRIAQAEDLEPLLGLFLAYRGFYQVEDRPEASKAFLASNIQDPGVLILLAELDDAIVGFAQVYRGRCSLELAPLWTLYDLYVEPTARRSGAAQALLIEVERLSLAEGVARLELSTAHDNLAAQSLYQRLGWNRESNFQVFIRTPGSSSHVP